ncbi:MAG TPA: histidinol dehydrogenase [Solirubrobacteraceae bacterium]|jgi:histidinol dehydrogenase|nr:histidinol dehydrogenase [Solirubrobacteraceae bacterium]
MRLERRTLAAAADAPALAAEVRGLAPSAEDVAPAVAEIVAAVRDGGDAAVAEYTRRFDTRGGEPGPLRVAPEDLTAALAALDPAVRNGLELAIANVDTVARAGLGEDLEVPLPQGQTVLVRELPVERAAVYVPGGRAPYPSTVVMGAVTARAAGVREVAVCAPPGEDGDLHPVILAACALCGVDEVYRMGGAQAVAALALGTEAVPAVDVLVGPGNLYVQEAKRQLSHRVGIDGFAGPSELLVVLAGDGARPARPATLDLLAQAEHGPESLVAAVATDPDVLRALAEDLEALAPSRPTAVASAAVLVQAPRLDAALAFAQALAPEHVELVGADAEAAAPAVTRAGAVYVGRAAGTAFGDYVAGSNHVLPTGGAARFASALGPSTFRRRTNEVHLGDAAPALAEAGAAVARAEGFVVHAQSMEARVQENATP